ncbi:MAG: hypothetical protein R8P61_29805 [Bacteroidia bacterium]|nr:hypothetical protein [Bacteroidia bacterium]
MKFFLVSIAFLVCSFTFPKYIIAQQGPAQNLPDSEVEELLETELAYQPEMQDFGQAKAVFVDFLRNSDTLSLELKELTRMYQQLELSGRLVIAFADPQKADLISLESQWIDFRSQVQSSFDRSWDQSEGRMSRGKFLFYETLIAEFSPKAEVLIEAMWAEEDDFLEKHREDTVIDLKIIFRKAYGQLRKLENEAAFLVMDE